MVGRHVADAPMWDQPEVHDVYRRGTACSPRSGRTG